MASEAIYRIEVIEVLQDEITDALTLSQSSDLMSSGFKLSLIDDHLASASKQIEKLKASLRAEAG